LLTLELHWWTPENVKLLLPPRQSRGSPDDVRIIVSIFNIIIIWLLIYSLGGIIIWVLHWIWTGKWQME
jgi:hypothetical protein